MPMIHIQLATPKSPALATGVIDAVMAHTAGILHKDPKLTAIALQWVDPQDWFVAGQSLHTLSASGFFLEIKITDETNTKQEKAHYVAAVFESMQSLLGDLNDKSYVHIHDVRAATYGYAGKTQEWRYQHPS